MIRRFAVLVAAALSFAQAPSFPADPPMQCTNCAEWNRPLEPFKLFGNSYYVGTAGLSAILITGDAGHILLDGALSQSAAVIDRNIRALGFKTEDVKLIVNSHAHFDHAGGLRALQRVSGATVAASAAGARALEAGEPTPDDPQYGFGKESNAFPAVANVKGVKDGEVLRVGALALTAHTTPGHTPGSTAWTWRACEGERCLDMVYADSLTPVSAPGFRYSGDAKTPSRIEAFRQSIAKVEALPCDIVVSTHPEFTGIDRKLAQLKTAPGSNPFVDRNGCRTYAAEARNRLEARIAEEAKTK